MDASSIITQVSRDDELGAFNSEKGECRLPVSCHPSPRAPKTFRQMLPGFRFPRTCYSTRIALLALSRLTLPFVPPPVLSVNNFSRVSELLFIPFLLLLSSIFAPLLTPSSSYLYILQIMSQIFVFSYAMSCPLTFHALRR